MNIVQINLTYRIGSTGKIIKDLGEVILNEGEYCYLAVGYGKSPSPNVYSVTDSNNSLYVKKDLLISRITGLMGYRNKRATKRLIEWIDSKNPDIIHLHNIHGDWINIGILFEYIKSKKVPIVWTLHDCWAFTGRCSHFENCNCFKWKTGCYKCNNLKTYPISYFFDFSSQMWEDKKKIFTGIKNCTIVTPSDWLGGYVKESFLNEYPCITIHNGIDISQFSVLDNIEPIQRITKGKEIVLGIASTWTKNKGLYDFIELDRILPSNYQIVLIGLNERQLKELPQSIIGIQRTSSINELVNWYNAATYFVNLTYLDNYPTTNLEAQACGTTVITYNTGGSSESVIDKQFVVEQGDINAVASIIISGKRRTMEECRNDAEQYFDANKCFQKYISLYNEIIKTT